MFPSGSETVTRYVGPVDEYEDAAPVSMNDIVDRSQNGTETVLSLMTVSRILRWSSLSRAILSSFK